MIDEASIPRRGPETAQAASTLHVDLSDGAANACRTPTPQEVGRVRGEDTPFEATVSDHAIRRALAEAAAHPPDEADLQARVFAGVAQRVDAVLDQRLRETLAPLLAGVAEAVVRETRAVLASSLRELVEQAVAGEIERRRAC